jgi:hypothetical protein
MRYTYKLANPRFYSMGGETNPPIIFEEALSGRNFRVIVDGRKVYVPEKLLIGMGAVEVDENGKSIK